MKRKIENEKGITLVALIITIIILIILAAVTINSLTHEGLADMAVKSTQDYQKAQSDEMNMLNEIDTMVKETLKNLEDGTVKPKPEEPTVPPEEQEVILTKDDIGKTIDYKRLASPGKYVISQDRSGKSGPDQTFTTADLEGTWNIWNVDENNIYLVSTQASTSCLYMEGAAGYNNGVIALNWICENCWNDEENYLDMKCRSMRLSDILPGLQAENEHADSFGKTPYQYTARFPSVWINYDFPGGDTLAAREKEWGWTTPDVYPTNKTEKPMFTLWNASNIYNKESFKGPYAQQYADMVFKCSSWPGYLLGTRITFAVEERYAWWGLQAVRDRDIRSELSWCLSDGEAGPNPMAGNIRPFAEIPKSSCIITRRRRKQCRVSYPTKG